jgi:hypothetical protein
MKIEPPAIETMWRQFSQLASGLSTVTDQEFDAVDINSLRNVLLSCLHILDQAMKRGDRPALEHLYSLTLQGCSLLKRSDTRDGDLVNGSRDRMPQVEKLFAAVPQQKGHELFPHMANAKGSGSAIFPANLRCEAGAWPGWTKLACRRTTLAAQSLRISAKSAIQAKEPREQRQLLKAILKLARARRELSLRLPAQKPNKTRSITLLSVSVAAQGRFTFMMKPAKGSPKQ